MVRKRNLLKGFFSYTHLTGVILLLILSACSGKQSTQTQETTLLPTQTLAPSPLPTQTVELSPTRTELAIAAPEYETPVPTATPLLGELIATRVPEPTSTPGPLQQRVINYVDRIGLATTRFLGLSLADWINLVISIGFVLIGYTLGTWVIRRLLPRLARRTPSKFDDELLKSIGPDIRWFVVVIILSYSTDRLTFFSVVLKTFLEDIYFVLGLILIIRISWKLVDLATEKYREKSYQQGRGNELVALIRMTNRISRILIGIMGIIILLTYFGVNVTALTAALGIGGLALSLAAKDTIADAIAGVILLVDRPFRVGDRIEIQGVNTWGDVTDIGLRTTRIRTRDNRLVIVPNSIISHNQVINYSYPDPRYRIETHVDIAFGTDVETVRRLLIDTVRQVEGVLPEKPVDALYVDMGGAAMKFRVRWWIESYADTRRMFDHVHTAIQHALDEAGIESPNSAANVNLLVGRSTAERISQAFKSQPAEGDRGDEDTLATGAGKEL